MNKPTFRTRGDKIPGLVALDAVRLWAKGLSTYGQRLLNRVEDGQLYSDFLICGARTGRFLSREPNLQNVPKRSRAFKAFRRIFAARDGSVVTVADYSQIELREIAVQSNDAVMDGIYRNYGRVHRDPERRKEFDIHRTTAKGPRPDLDDLTPEEQDGIRSTSKAANFGLTYGAGPHGFAAQAKAQFEIDMTVNEARDIIDTCRETYPSVAQWQRDQRENSREQGYTTTVGGRCWYWNWRSKSINDPTLADVPE